MTGQSGGQSVVKVKRDQSSVDWPWSLGARDAVRLVAVVNIYDPKAILAISAISAKSLQVYLNEL